MKVKLVVVEGRQKGREIPLPSTVFVIGRDAQCHLRPHSELVSRLHCAIARKANRVVVRDLQSSNGTYVNDQPVKGEVFIQDGDRLQVGDLVFAFKIEATSEPQPIQIVEEREVDWLMARASDSSVLQPKRRTKIVVDNTASNGSKSAASNAPANAGPPPAQTAHNTGSRSVSAGEYLKDYLREKK